MPALPQVCPMCGYGEAVTSEAVGLGVWSYTCSDHSHPEFTWVASDPKVRSTALQQKDQTLSDELGIYDDLLTTFAYGEAPVEHGVVEYRYALAAPEKYRFLIDRYSHIQQERGLQYTASSFIAGALARLWRRGDLHFELAPATGFWKYNETIGAWALTDPAQPVKSWVDFATDINLHADPWPLDDLLRSE